ncbi:hypothetical protein FRC01_010332, partial [Tulasnella sp. 417]
MLPVHTKQGVVFHKPRRRVVAVAILLFVFLLTLSLSSRRSGHESVQVGEMLVDKPPSLDKPSHSEGFKPTSSDPNRPTTIPTPQAFALDKLHFLNGKPTGAFRGRSYVRRSTPSTWILNSELVSLKKDNLKPDLKYVTTWNYAGMTNDVMVLMNLIYLGMHSNRTPILFPLAGSEDHLGRGPETLGAGNVFDLPRLSQAIGHQVLDWQDVKRGRYNLPWGGEDYNAHDDDELVGCWSIYQTLSAEKKPLDREMPHFLHLDVQYTGVPLSVEFTKLGTGQTSFKLLSHLLSSTGRSEALSAQLPLPTWGKRPLPPTTPFPEPDDQLACFDNLYWVWSEEYWEWEKYPSPTWHAVGVHMHFTKEVDEIASKYLRMVFGLKEDEQVPPFISIHARHGDFKNLCQNSKDLTSCYPPLMEFSRHVQDVAAELSRINGPDSPLAKVTEVVVTSDESDPEWWKEVERMGWRHLKSYESEIAQRYGKWYPTILDSVVQSRGAGFIGTKLSTMSIIAARRVIDWNNGPWRL